MRKRSKRTYLQMAETYEKQPVLLNSTFSLPRNISKTLSEKIENLLEYSYIPEDAQISQSLNPLLSPYNIFKRHRYSLRSITVWSPLEDSIWKNMSSIQEWTSARWLLLLRSNMSILKFQNNLSEDGNNRDTLIFTMEPLGWYYPYMAEEDFPWLPESPF